MKVLFKKNTPQPKMMIAHWIDLGCLINFGQESSNGAWGWFLNDLHPTLLRGE